MAYQPNGKRLIIGFRTTGLCAVYQSDDLGRLNYITKLNCKNRRGAFANGSKVTGISFLNEKEVLITTSDSRLRLFNLDDVIQKVKFKGFKGEHLLLRSSFNNSNTRITLGSEDGSVYLWDIDRIGNNLFREAKQKGYEAFLPFMI